MERQFDVVVLGGGPAGYSAAFRAADLGGTVALIEQDGLGGTCLHRGCVPTKMAAELAGGVESLRRLRSLGLRAGRPSVSWTEFSSWRAARIAALQSGLEELAAARRVALFRGQGTMARGGAVSVRDEAGAQVELKGERVVIATGSVAVRPQIPGIDLPGVYDPEEFVLLDGVPQRLVIIGGGVIGAEFASIYSRLGCRVALLEMADRLLPGADEEAAAYVHEGLGEAGVEVHLRTRPTEILPSGEGLCVRAEGSASSLSGEAVVVAVGRTARQDGWRELGLETSGGFLVVDEWLRTSHAEVYAAGDVAGGGHLLAHVAFAQGAVAAENALGGRARLALSAVPMAVFTIPEVGAIGKTEHQARREGLKVRVGRFPLGANARAVLGGWEKGFVKIVVDDRWDQVVGVHVVGAGAAELVSVASLALAVEATAEELAAVLQAHPTCAEAVGEAAAATRGRSLHFIAPAFSPDNCAEPPGL